MAKQQQEQSGAEGGDDAPRKCAMWMSKKRRFCAMAALPTSTYCGNHRIVAGEKRVPCPVDPSHTILEENVEAHVKKCPAAKISKLSELKSYFCQGVNAGCGGEDCYDTSSDLRDSSAAVDPSVEGDKSRSSAIKRKAIAGLSDDQLREFVKRIEFAYEVCCLGTDDEAFFQPPQCSKWWDPDRDRRLPFQEKHVSQQASLLGNLEAFGLLQAETRRADGKQQDDNENWVYVEFGAGRGYLSHMLCDSYGVSSVVLVERSAYKFKADRTLRQILGVSVERLRTDIEDLQLHGVGSLQGRHFVAVSKHLCGPATGFSFAMLFLSTGGNSAERVFALCSGLENWLATDLTLRCCLNINSGMSSKPPGPRSCCTKPILEGIGIATCCHHLCQWKSYVNKEFFRKLGFSVSDFDMMTWLTSWAVNQSGEHDHTEIKVLDQKGIRQGSLEGLDSAAQDKPPLREAMSILDPLQRNVLGRKCKDLLDHGRLLWLKQHGLDAKIVKYISSAITPENKLLLARKFYAQDESVTPGHSLT